jgi:TatD DNase family protein
VEVVNRAEKSGVKIIVASGVNPSTNRIVLNLSKKYDIVKCSFGIYPVDAISNQLKDAGDEDYMRYVEKFDVDGELKWIEEHKNDCVAIGEVGLDFKIVPGTENLQEPIFRKIIQLAKRLDKTLVIHSRKAELRAIEIMEEEGAEKVLMHCFSGKKSLIKRCVENGWYLSIPAVITRFEHFKMMAEIVPLENLMTETDAPYLAAVAGERSEP